MQGISGQTAQVRCRNVSKCQRQEKTAVLEELQMYRLRGQKKEWQEMRLKYTQESIHIGFLGNIRFVFKCHWKNPITFKPENDII